jgi:hypothetical protein
MTNISAVSMGLESWPKPQYEPDPRVTRVVEKWLREIYADTVGSEEVLYHGFQNKRGVVFTVGDTVRLPLQAASGDLESSASYGIRSDAGDQQGEPTVLRFPRGTRMVAYGKWRTKADAEEFQHVYLEAIVAGAFRVARVEHHLVRHGQHDRANDTYEPYQRVRVVTLEPTGVFNPDTKQWESLSAEPLDLSVGMGKRWEGHTTRVADDPDQVRDFRIGAKEVNPEDFFGTQGGDTRRAWVVGLRKKGPDGPGTSLGYISLLLQRKVYVDDPRRLRPEDVTHNKYAGQYLSVGTAALAEGMRGKGWGVRLYLRALTLAKSLGLKGVVSHQPTMSRHGMIGRKPGANAVWDWFVEQGMAERHEDGYDVLLHTTPQKIAASVSWPMEDEADEQAIHLAVGMGKRWEGHAKVREAEDILASAEAEGKAVLFHSGDASIDESLAAGIEPMFGEWLEEVLAGATDDDELVQQIREQDPVTFFSKEPSWVSMKVARKLGKTLDDVTVEDVRAHGQLSIVVVHDPEDFLHTVEDGQAVARFGESRVQTHDVPFGVEPKDIFADHAIAPDITLTGEALVSFLARNYPDSNLLKRGESLTQSSLDLAVGMGKRWEGHAKEGAAPRQPLKYFTPYYEDERPNPAGPHEPAMLPRLGKEGVPVEQVEVVKILGGEPDTDSEWTMTIVTGKVPEGEPVLVYRTVPLSTLLRAARTGDFASQKKFAASWEGQTQVGIDPGDTAMWNPPAGTGKFLAQIDIQGMSVRVASNTGQFHETTSTFTGDTGLGIGVDGPIPVARVLKVWRLEGSFPIHQLYPVKLDVSGPKPTSFNLAVGMGKRWEGHTKKGEAKVEEGPEPLDEGTLGSIRAAGGEEAVRRAEANRMNVFRRTKETQQVPIPATLTLAPLDSPLALGATDDHRMSLIGGTADETLRNVTTALEDAARAAGLRGIRVAEVRLMTPEEAHDPNVAGTYDIFGNRIALSANVVAQVGQYLGGQRTPPGIEPTNRSPETGVYALAHEVLHASDPTFRAFTPAMLEHPLGLLLTEALNDTLAKRLVEGPLGFPPMRSDYRPLVDNLNELGTALGRDVAHEAWQQTSVQVRADVVGKAILDYLEPARFVDTPVNRQVWDEIAPYAAALLALSAPDTTTGRMMGGLRELKKHLARDEHGATIAVAGMLSQLRRTFAAQQEQED